jgi:hypothetical protein
MGKINITNMVNMPLRVRSHILTTLDSKVDKTWEYNPNDYILIMDLCKLLIPISYEDKK